MRQIFTDVRLYIMEILQNEILSFGLIALVIIALAIMTKKRESDFTKFDENESNDEENK